MNGVASPHRQSGLAADLLLALGQLPDGGRLSELARAVRAPLSSAQSSLAGLVRAGLVEREAGPRSGYRLSPRGRQSRPVDRPSARHVVIRLVDIVLRANPAIVLAARDEAGYVLVRRDGDPASERAFNAIDDLSPEGQIRLSTFEAAEFWRILKVAIDLRARIGSAELVKAPPVVAASSASALRAVGPGRTRRATGRGPH